MKKLDLENTKNVVNEIINLNQRYRVLVNQLQDLQRKYQYGLSFTKDTFNIFNFIDHLTEFNNATIIKKEILSNNLSLLEQYFKKILAESIYPGGELPFAMDSLLNNYSILEKMIFEQFGPMDLIIIWRKCCLVSNYTITKRKNINYIPVPLEESSSKIFIDYLPIIWQKYSDKLFLKARRGPKKMLILFYLFQEYFNDKQFEVFVKRIKKYDDQFLHNYVIKCSRNLPPKYLNQLASSFLLNDLK